jgi:hypothetical protein
MKDASTRKRRLENGSAAQFAYGERARLGRSSARLAPKIEGKGYSIAKFWPRVPTAMARLAAPEAGALPIFYFFYARYIHGGITPTPPSDV